MEIWCASIRVRGCTISNVAVQDLGIANAAYLMVKCIIGILRHLGVSVWEFRV